MHKPLAFMKEGAGKFIWHLKKENFASGFGILFRGIFAYYLIKGAFWAVKSLVSRIHRRLVNVYRAAFNRQDEANQLPDAPPIARDGIDKIDIEDYTCT